VGYQTSVSGRESFGKPTCSLSLDTPLTYFPYDGNCILRLIQTQEVHDNLAQNSNHPPYTYTHPSCRLDDPLFRQFIHNSNIVLEAQRLSTASTTCAPLDTKHRWRPIDPRLTPLAIPSACFCFLCLPRMRTICASRKRWCCGLVRTKWGSGRIHLRSCWKAF